MKVLSARAFAGVHCDLVCTRDDGTPFLYLGGEEYAQENVKIKYILTVMGKTKVVLKKGQKHLHVPLSDEVQVDIRRHFTACHNFIDNAYLEGDGAVLVHCGAGVSRSGSIVLSYLMKTFGLTLHDAFVICKPLRPKLHPNCGFMQQLLRYEKELFPAQYPSICIKTYTKEWIVKYRPYAWYCTPKLIQALEDNDYDIDLAVASMHADVPAISNPPLHHPLQSVITNSFAFRMCFGFQKVTPDKDRFSFKKPTQELSREPCRVVS